MTHQPWRDIHPRSLEDVKQYVEYVCPDGVELSMVSAPRWMHPVTKWTGPVLLVFLDGKLAKPPLYGERGTIPTYGEALSYVFMALLKLKSAPPQLECKSEATRDIDQIFTQELPQTIHCGLWKVLPDKQLNQRFFGVDELCLFRVTTVDEGGYTHGGVMPIPLGLEASDLRKFAQEAGEGVKNLLEESAIAKVQALQARMRDPQLAMPKPEPARKRMDQKLRDLATYRHRS
jgi:hypothetical protein